MFRRLAELILVLKWPLLLCLVLLTAISTGALRRLTIDPSMESLFIKSSEEYQFYKQYRETYGSDQVIAVAMETPDLFTEGNLRRLGDITSRVEAIPGVERVISLSNAMDIKHRMFGIKVVPALRELDRDEPDVDEIREEVLGNELFVGNIVSEDGKVAAILIFLSPSGKDIGSGELVIRKLRQLLEKEEQRGLKFYIAGAPVEQYDFIRLIKKDQFTFVPMITLLLIVTTYLIYRSLACMVLSMSIVFMTLSWTLGTIVFLGEELNLMTSLLAPVIMIVSVVNSIHLMNLFFELRPHHPSLRRAVVLTIEQLGVPCFLSHFTTILGFASLAISPIPAISSFGIFAALGTFYSYFVEILLTPILLPILPYRRVGDSFSDRNVINRVVVDFLEKLEFRWKWWIIILTFVGIILSFQGIQKIQVDTNIVKQMKPDLPLAVATRFIDENLTGVYTLGYVLKRRGGETVVDPETLQVIDDFKNYLESKPEITKVNSVTTLVKKIHEARENEKEAYVIPQDQGTLESYFEGIAESEDPEVWKLVSRDFTQVRLEARMKAVGTREGGVVEDDVNIYMREHLESLFDYRQTGNVILLGRMAKDLVQQQVRSFGFAFLSILLLIILIFRSLKMGLLAAIPNLFPIMGVYGIMGFLGIELSSTTAMISSIVLGMVVDASIHFLHRFRFEFEHRYHYVQSLHHTFRNVGQALTVSTLILVVGFASSVLANFKPTVYFGVFTSLTIFLALVCTLVILPVVLVIIKPFGSEKLFRRPKNSPKEIP